MSYSVMFCVQVRGAHARSQCIQVRQLPSSSAHYLFSLPSPGSGGSLLVSEAAGEGAFWAPLAPPAVLDTLSPGSLIILHL